MKKIDLDNILVLANRIENISEQYDISLIDACVHYCESNDIEIEYVGDILKKNQRLSLKIEKEAEKLNFLRKKKRIK
jgi:16S rRNA G527 N7-methylase RsmG